MKQRFTLLLAMAALVSVSSCKKDKDEEPKVPTKTELLLAKKWRLSAIKYILNNTTEDGYAALKPCEKDNFWKFNTDKTVTYDEGATKCFPNGPQTDTGTWDIASNDTKFVLDGQQYDIVELSASTLHFNITVTQNGQTSSMDVTLNSF